MSSVSHAQCMHLLLCIAHITHNIVHAVHLSYKVTSSRLLTKIDHEFATYVHYKFRTSTYTVKYSCFIFITPIGQ